MSKTVDIQSASQFSTLLTTSKIVVADFHATWCGPCKQIAPLYEQLSFQLSRPTKITFTKIDTDKQQELARAYGVTSLPSFIIFKNGRVTQSIKGADPSQLSGAVRRLANEAELAGESDENTMGGVAQSSNSSQWAGAEPAKGYSDVSDQVDIKGLELLNFDNSLGNVRALFESRKPSSLSTSGDGARTAKDWVESDTDDQLMLYIPFQSTLKIHSLHLTSILPKPDSEDNDTEIPMRPKTIKVYPNRSHILGFEEAEDLPATQSVTLESRDWDANTSTAKIELRFVKFQNVSSLVIFVVDGDGEGDKVRLDRVRIVGETGEKRDAKIEKIGDDHD